MQERIPTYLKDTNYKILKLEEDITSLQIAPENSLEDFEIYYYGDLFENQYIVDVFEDDTIIPCKILLKNINSNEEILLIDIAKHGYNSMFCDEFDKEKVAKRELKKLDVVPSNIEITFSYSIDYEEERDDFLEEGADTLETINGETVSWDEVLKNGFDFISIKVTNSEGKEIEICHLELA